MARAAVERALALDEDLARAHTTSGWIQLFYDWDWQGADAAMQRGLALAPGDADVLTGAGVGLAAFIDEHGEWAAVQIAEIYAWRGEADSAFAWLDTAYRQRDGGLAEILADLLLANLESDARWPTFLDKMGLPTEGIMASTP